MATSRRLSSPRNYALEAIATFAYSSELPAHYLGRRDLGHLGQGTNSRDDTESDSGMPPG
jgi:hypothetical protein